MGSLKKWWSKFSSEDKAGIYLTVTIHLFVIAVLLVVQIGRLTFGENGILIDLSKLEEKEKEVEETGLREDVSRKLDELIRNAMSQTTDEQDVRNIAVNMSSLKDDRGTNAEELYKEAERIQNELKNPAVKEDARDETVDLSPIDKTGRETEYKGPSVVSYLLEGRTAVSLRIPAYKCLGGGDVTVLITVNPKGTVIDARVNEAVSSEDSCLRNHAVRAALSSKFTSLGSARPSSLDSSGNQTGEIVYRYIPQ